jgi:hypothetical protein
MSYVVVSRKDDTATGPFVLAVRGVSYPEGLSMVQCLVEQGIQAYLQTISEKHEWLLMRRQDQLNFWMEDSNG